jgi:3-phenylpropionate/cinnamic acid dioxygenase small subunit
MADSSDIAGRLQRLVDRADIEDLLSRYARACDTKDWELYRAVFTPDAVIDYTKAYGVRGPVPEVSSWMAKLMTPDYVPETQHMLANVEITIDGDNASAHAYYINPDVRSDGAGGFGLLLNGGYYTARVCRGPEGWRIARLVAEITFSHSGDLEQVQIRQVE